MLHYELTGERRRRSSGGYLHRIRSTCALRVADRDVRKNETGGWVSSLRLADGSPRLRDDAWVADEARVCDDAFVSGSAVVGGGAWVRDQASVIGSSRVAGRARLSDFAQVSDRAQVGGSARLEWGATITGRARVDGRALFVDWSGIGDDAWVTGDAFVQSMADCTTIDDLPGSIGVATLFFTFSHEPLLTIGRGWFGRLTDLRRAAAGATEPPPSLRRQLGADWRQSSERLLSVGEAWFAERRRHYGWE